MAPARHAAFAEESAEVEVLYANLEKMKSLSRKIQGSMARLDVSGKVVQDAIGPIYGNTQRLQTTTTNVDRITEAIEKARQPLDMRNREEQVLRERPERVGLGQYIASMDRTNRALKDLKASNMRSNQKAAADLSELLEVGTRNLETVFRDVVRQDSQPIEPLQQIMRGNEFPKFSQKSSAELRTINGQVASFQAQSSNTDLSPTAKVYAQERGQYIQLSLQNLSAASLSTARKVNADAVYKPGSNGIATYCSGIQGMFIAEYACICEIFQREEWNPVLTATCQSALAAFGNTLRDLDNHIRTNLITDCYLAYEIVDLVSNTSFQLEEKTGMLKQQMSDALKPVRETAKASLSILLNDTRNKIQQITVLPSDGSAVPLTSDVMQRLQLMTAFLPPLSSIMRSLGDGGWTSTPNATASSTSSVPTLNPLTLEQTEHSYSPTTAPTRSKRYSPTSTRGRAHYSR
jgi:exocyst complex protein 7